LSLAAPLSIRCAQDDRLQVVYQQSPHLQPTRAEQEPDASVRFVVTILDFLRWAMPYEWAAALARRSGRRLGPNFIAAYAVAWLGALALVFAFAPSMDEPTKWGAAIVPAWCICEVTRWWLSVLLNRRHNRFVSFERNIVYLFVNLAQVIVAGATFLRMTSPDQSAVKALFDSFSLATLLSNTPHASGLHDAAQAITVSASLVLVAGGLTILLGGMAPFFTEGDYEGPWRLPSKRSAVRRPLAAGQPGTDELADS
jgi:hypothetical protein